MSPLDYETDERWKRTHTAAEIIESARRLLVPKLTQKEAARLSGVDPTYWPVVIRGYRTINGQQVKLVPPDDTLLRMAIAVGVEAQVREALGTPAIHREPIDTAAGPGVVLTDEAWWQRLSDEDRDRLRELGQRLAETEGDPGA